MKSGLGKKIVSFANNSKLCLFLHWSCNHVYWRLGRIQVLYQKKSRKTNVYHHPIWIHTYTFISFLHESSSRVSIFLHSPVIYSKTMSSRTIYVCCSRSEVRDGKWNKFERISQEGSRTTVRIKVCRPWLPKRISEEIGSPILLAIGSTSCGPG